MKVSCAKESRGVGNIADSAGEQRLIGRGRAGIVDDMRARGEIIRRIVVDDAVEGVPREAAA